MVTRNQAEAVKSSFRPSCRLCSALVEEEDLSADFLGVTATGVTRDVAVLSDRTPLVPGHLLIVSRRHCRSVGTLGSRQSVESFITALNGIRDRYESGGLCVVAFEHGPRRYGEAGSCIDHAHVHLVPCTKEVSVNDIPFSQFLRSVGLIDWRRMHELDSLRLLSTHVSYLWIQDTFGVSAVTVVGVNDCVPSQSLRRWCAELLGVESWDWRSKLGYAPSGTLPGRSGPFG